MIPIIEVFGLPGSGKTYFVNELRKCNRHDSALHFLSIEELSLRGLQHRDDGTLTNYIKKLPDRFWHSTLNEDYSHQEFLDFASGNVELFQFIFSVLAGAQVSTNHYRSILGAFSRTTIAHELGTICRHNIGEVLLADEWFCHRFYTLFGNTYTTPSSDQIYDYIRLIPLSSIIVFIATSPEECLRRMRQRDRFPVLLAELSPDNRKSRLEEAFSSLREFSFTLKKQGRVVIEYHGSSMEHQRIWDECRKSLQFANSVG